MFRLDTLRKFDQFGRPVNLRFNGADKFKTSCGALATLFLGVILSILFLFYLKDFKNGKIDSYNYMIRNSPNVFRKPEAHDTKENYEVLGFGMEEKYYNQKLLKLDASIMTGADVFKHVPHLTDCTEEVFAELNVQQKEIVPKNLVIRCMKIDSKLLKSGIKPSIMISECTGKGCMEQKKRKELLEEFSAWAFTKADATDFTSSDTKLVERYTGDEIFLSRSYYKKSKVVLRQVEVSIEKGVFFPATSKRMTSMYLSNIQRIVSVTEDPEILELSLEIDNNSEVLITKKFQTLAKLLSFVGGLSQGITLILMIFVFPVREVLYYQQLMNDMFNVCLNENQVDLAYRMMKARKEEDDTEDDEGDEEVGRGQVPFDTKKKVGSNDTGSKLKYLSKVLARQESDGQCGLMDEIIENMTADKIMENMLKGLKGLDTDGGNVLDQVLNKGLNYKERRKKEIEEKYRGKRNSRGRYSDGKFVELDQYDVDFLNKRSVKLKIMKWKNAVQEKYLTKMVEKDNLEENMNNLHRARRSNREDSLANKDKDSLIFRKTTFGISKKDSPMKTKEGFFKENDKKVDKLEEEEIDNSKRHQSRHFVVNKSLNFSTSMRGINPNDAGGGGGNKGNLSSNRSIDKKMEDKEDGFYVDFMSTERNLATDATPGSNRSTKKSSLMKKKRAKEVLVGTSEELRNPNEGGTDDSTGFFGKVRRSLGMSREPNSVQSISKLGKEQEKKISDIKNQQQFMLESSSKLSFYTHFFDYIKLWIPGILSKNTKRDLYIQVTKPTNPNN